MGRAQGGIIAAQVGRPRKYPRYTEEELRRELEAMTAGVDVWPTNHEFIAHGRADLLASIHATGGAARWANELGKTLTEGQRRCVRRWTEEELASELERFIDGARVFPTRDAFIAAGRYDLYNALRRHGGFDRWTGSLARAKKTYRTDAELEAELQEFIGDRDDWPTRNEFTAAHRLGLFKAARNRGGVDVWAARLGKTLSAHQRASVEGRRGPAARRPRTAQPPDPS